MAGFLWAHVALVDQPAFNETIKCLVHLRIGLNASCSVRLD